MTLVYTSTVMTDVLVEDCHGEGEGGAASLAYFSYTTVSIIYRLTHLTSPRLASPRLTPPHFTSPHPISPNLTSRYRVVVCSTTDVQCFHHWMHFGNTRRCPVRHIGWETDHGQ